jgi:hypothetical protein
MSAPDELGTATHCKMGTRSINDTSFFNNTLSAAGDAFLNSDLTAKEATILKSALLVGVEQQLLTGKRRTTRAALSGTQWSGLYVRWIRNIGNQTICW